MKPAAHAAAIVTAAVLVVVLKELFLFADHTPRFFLGDSASYVLASGLEWAPGDRSYSYGYLVYLFGVLPRSLPVLIMVQAAAGAASSILLALILVRTLDTRPSVAVGAAVLSSVDPTQLVLERQVMTEAFALFLLATVVALSCAYLRAPRLWRLLAVQVTGVALVSLRTVYIPVVLGIAALLPLMASRAIRGRPPIATRAGHLSALAMVGVHVAVSIASAFVTHQGYRAYTGWVSSREPAYQYADGLFLISAVAPILMEADAASPAVARVIARTDLRDLKARNYQRWGEQGLVTGVHAEVGDWKVTNALCRETAMRAIRRDPLGTLSLALGTYGLYWDSGHMRWIVEAAEQQRQFVLTEDFRRTLRRKFGYAAVPRQNGEPVSVTQRLQLAANAPWRYVALLSPLLAMLAVWTSPRPGRPAALLIAFVTVLLAIVTFTGITETLNRYLQPLTWLGLLSTAVVVDSLRPRRGLILPDGT